MIELRPLWATPIFSTTASTNAIVKARSKILEDYARCQAQGLWATHDQLNLELEFADLSAEILEFANQCLDHLTVKRDSIYITCMWSNVSPVGHPHSNHQHPNSFYSGLVYLQVPPNSAGTTFRDPRPAAQVLVPEYHRPSIEFMGQDYVIPAEESKMLLWPSWVAHQVEPVKSGPGLRISLSFNIMLRTEITIPSLRLDTKAL